MRSTLRLAVAFGCIVAFGIYFYSLLFLDSSIFVEFKISLYFWNDFLKLFIIILAFAVNDKELTGEEKLTNTEEPQYWQAILGDICQLPGFPRATGDPQRYVECVKQNLDTGDR